MRKVVVIEHISLDGVIQGPGGREEDPSGGFTQGGWISGYADSILGEELSELMGSPFDLLLGRKTYEIWAPYWPIHAEAWPRADAARKYLVSTSLDSGSWKPTQVLRGGLAEEIGRIKGEEGPELHVWGSGKLVQSLLRLGLVDALRLMIYPIALGGGKRLFAEGSGPARFALGSCRATTTGVLLARYERLP